MSKFPIRPEICESANLVLTTVGVIDETGMQCWKLFHDTITSRYLRVRALSQVKEQLPVLHAVRLQRIINRLQKWQRRRKLWHAVEELPINFHLITRLSFVFTIRGQAEVAALEFIGEAFVVDAELVSSLRL